MKIFEHNTFEKMQLINQPLKFKEIIKRYFWSAFSSIMDRIPFLYSFSLQELFLDLKGVLKTQPNTYK